MLRPLLANLTLCLPLVAQVPASAAVAQKPAAATQAKAQAQAKGQEQGKAGTRPASQDKRSAEARAQRRAEFEARRPLLEAFPRTQRLLAFLHRVDETTYKAVVEHAARIAARRENQALGLARRHVPELHRLVRRLRRTSLKAYQRAIRELVADHARLERARAQSEEAFQAALLDWQFNTKLRLLTARLRLGVDAEQKAKILRSAKDLLAKRDQARRELLRQQKQRHMQQIQKLDKRLAEDADENIQRQLRAIERSARKARPRNKRGK